ncbi:MAG: nucleotidyltransferase domain-containing protein [Gammaproteobacteria bacterium]|nr:nucleotidyltransferase domain-containing protein [Gammaproteobacteria bacterium]MCP5196096.1 nucleotidyltransferase domain-containing protein [Gammaproteobacteria bacterium]
MLLDEIQQKKSIIKAKALASEYGARHLRVFGSVTRREECPDSDVDFLVDFPSGYNLFTQRLPLIGKLSDLLLCKVELAPEYELNRYIREQVLGEAVEL